MHVAKPEALLQEFRAIYKNNETGAITHFSTTVSITSQFDDKLEQHVILWSDIKSAFKTPMQVWRENIPVLYLADENFET